MLKMDYVMRSVVNGASENLWNAHNAQIADINQQLVYKFLLNIAFYHVVDCSSLIFYASDFGSFSIRVHFFPRSYFNFGSGDRLKLLCAVHAMASCCYLADLAACIITISIHFLFVRLSWRFSSAVFAFCCACVSLMEMRLHRNH